MAEISAIAISNIEGAMVTDDGKSLLLKGTQPNGTEVVLAFPSEQLVSLVDLAAFGRTQCRKAIGVDPDVREPYATTWWELSQDPANGKVILSLTFGSGGRLDFWLVGQMPSAMLETLEVLTGKFTGHSPGARPI